MQAIVRARISSKGQITLPKALRDALDLREGEMVEFELGEGEAVMRSANGGFLALYGSVKAAKEPVDWREARRVTAERVAHDIANEDR
jgi:AbrB family looped-hinge helix DNA binding protein